MLHMRHLINRRPSVLLVAAALTLAVAAVIFGGNRGLALAQEPTPLPAPQWNEAGWRHGGGAGDRTRVAWHPVPGATGYELQIQRHRDWQTLLVYLFPEFSAWATHLTLADTVYAFRVRASNSRATSDWSVVRETTLLPAESGICTRQVHVRIAILNALTGVSECQKVTDAHLASVNRINLNGKGIWFFEPGDFDGLSNLETLELQNNLLSSFPSNFFDPLTNLTSLNLDNNRIYSLPGGIFDPLANLTSLNLDNNRIYSLPGGIFDPLTNLTSLNLNYNRIGSLPEGIFNQLTRLEVLGLAGNDISELPEGIFDQLPATVTKILDTLSSTDGICGRTLQVRQGIVKLVPGIVECQDVTTTHLGAITGELDLSSNDIAAIKQGDFAGLGSVNWLDLRHNDLTSLQADAFDGLIGLQGLNLMANRLTSLPQGVFNGLPNLRGLELEHNGLRSLPIGTFDQLPSLRRLYLEYNDLRSLPLGIFDQLPSLQGLYLTTNTFRSLPAGIFDQLPSDTDVELDYGVTFEPLNRQQQQLVPIPTPDSPRTPTPTLSATVQLSPSGSVDKGTEIVVTMTFNGLEFDSDTSDTDYIFRADVRDADGCEGGGMGKDRYMYKVDEDPEVRTGTISASCAPGDYTLEVSITAADNVQFSAAAAIFAVVAQTPVEAPRQGETDTQTTEPTVAVELSPSGSVDEGTEITVTMSFANLESDTDTSDTDYIFRADVVNADACEGGGMGNDRYMYKVDEDPEVRTGSISASCEPGDYTVEVSIASPADVELASATAGFTVNAPAQQQQQAQEPPPSTDAALSGLTLSGVNFGAFNSATIGYTARVPNAVDETTVTPTTNDDGATYAIKLGGVTDDDGVIPLAVGSNVITVEVTAEDGNTAKTYTVTVTRAAPPSTDATLSSLTLSDAPFAFASDTTSYDVNVANGVDETTVTATANGGGASYVVKLGDAVDGDGTVELSVGGNVIAVEVTAEDGKTTKTYTVTVTRADPPPPDPVEPEPESTGERSAWLEQNPENKPFVGEWQHFTLRGSGLDKVDLSVNVIGFGGAPSSTGAVGYATASPLPAAGEVCGSAYYSGYQMSVDRTFSLVGCREGTVIIELLDPGNGYALLKRYTVTVTGGP